MSAEPTTLLDPEIEDLLRRIARDPRSTLLRVTRPQLAKGLFERSPAVGAQAAGLTTAERQLLCVHREETALLLRQLFYHRFLRDERMRRMTCMYAAGGKKIELGSEQDLGGRLAVQADPTTSDLGDAGASHVLADALALPPDAVASPSQIALAALRLVPSDNARNYLGYQLVRSGNLRSALRIFEDVAARSPRLSSVVSALSWSGFAYSQMNEPRLCQEMFAKAVRQGDGWPNDAMSWLTISVQLGDLQQAERAAAWVDRVCNPDDQVVRWWVEARIRERGVAWSPSKAAQGSISALRDRVGETSQAVLNVFGVVPAMVTAEVGGSGDPPASARGQRLLELV